MTAAVPDPPTAEQSVDERPVWDSGIGGAQCDICGETTIVRHFGSWDDADNQLLCRACAENWDSGWGDLDD